MTIAAGFVCSDGIVLCADSEETQSYIRTSVDKLVTYDEDWCKLAAAGSGTGDLVDAMVEKIFERLDAVQPENIISAKTEVEDVILSFHERQIAYHPEEDRVIDLIIGVKPKQSPEAVLWKTHGPTLATIQDKHVIGSGTIVRQIAEQLYIPDQSYRRSVLIAASILYEAKHHVRGCGGWSRITAILNSGEMESKQFTELIDMEEYIGEFKSAMRDLFFCCADLDEEKFAKEFEDFRKKIGEARQNLAIGYDFFERHKSRLTRPRKKRKR